MPASALSKKATTKKDVRHVVGKAADGLAIATHDGALNVGSLEDWIAAMRERQQRQQNQIEWVRVVNDLGDACRSWLGFNRWAKEIAVRFNGEPANVMLFVVARNSDAINVERRRDVADMGLVLAGGFNVRAEARITTSRPENHTFILA